MRLALSFVVVVAAGCDGLGLGGTGPLVVRKVLVDVEPAAQGIDREVVRNVINETVQKARGIKLVDAADDGAIMRIRIEGYGPERADKKRELPAGHPPVETKKDAPVDEGEPPVVASPPPTQDGGPGGRTTLALTIEVTGVPGEQGGYRGHALAHGSGTLDARLLVEQGMRDALAQVLMTRGAADHDSATLISWIEDPATGIEQKRRAIRILGSRRERDAVEPLARVLTEGEREVQPLALAALTNIGDPGAADAVIAYSDRQPPIVKKQCIEAVRTMGAPRGRAWLFTLSTGHPDEDVQQQALAALRSLEGGGAQDDGAAIAESATPPPTEATR